MMPIPNTGICTNCNGIYTLHRRCSCMANNSEPQGGDLHMGEFWFTCPSCGKSHLMILGATVKSDKDGSIVAVCPDLPTVQE